MKYLRQADNGNPVKGAGELLFDLGFLASVFGPGGVWRRGWTQGLGSVEDRISGDEDYERA